MPNGKHEAQDKRSSDAVDDEPAVEVPHVCGMCGWWERRLGPIGECTLNMELKPQSNTCNNWKQSLT